MSGGRLLETAPSFDPPEHLVSGLISSRLNRAGQIGNKVGEDGLGIRKIEAAGDILRGVVGDCGEIGSKPAEQRSQVLRAVLQIERIRIDGDWPRRMVDQGGEKRNWD